MKSPTTKKRVFAIQIGIEVDKTMTNHDLSVAINRRLAERREEDHEKKLAFMTLKASELRAWLKEKNVGPDSALLFAGTSPEFFLRANLLAGCIICMAVDSKGQWKPRASEILDKKDSVEIVTIPVGYIHFSAIKVPHRKYVDARLASDRRMSFHGTELWHADAVNVCLSQYDADGRTQLERKEEAGRVRVEEKERAHTERMATPFQAFCASCGDKFEQDRKVRGIEKTCRKCRASPQRLRETVRHCTACGTVFTPPHQKKWKCERCSLPK